MNTHKKDGFAMLLGSLAIGTFMSALDTSAVTVATPSIKTAFGVSLSAVEWVITGYLLVISSLLLTFGRLADMYGQRRIYTVGFSVFTAGSLVCGFAPNVGSLVAFRVVQALGAGMMFSSSSAIITANVPGERRGKAFGIIAIAVAAACCVGPVVGGVLVTAFGWRSIFFVNVPVGIVGTVCALRFIPVDGPRAPAKFDLPGGVLAFAALFLVLLPLDLSASDGFPLPVFLALLCGGLILVAAFIYREKTAEEPMLNLSLFENRVFSASLTATVFNFAAQFMMAFLAPYYFQSVRHMTPMLTGLLYLPMPIATIFVAPLSGSYSDRHDSRLLAAGGMGAMALGIGAMAFLDADTPYWFIVCAMALAGAGSGMFQSPNNSAIMGSAPARYRGAASGTLATMRNVGMVLGVALSGAIFNRANARALASLSSAGLSGADLARASATHGLRVTFAVASCSALVAMFASLQKKTGEPLRIRPYAGDRT